MRSPCGFSTGRKNSTPSILVRKRAYFLHWLGNSFTALLGRPVLIHCSSFMHSGSTACSAASSSLVGITSTRRLTADAISVPVAASCSTPLVAAVIQSATSLSVKSGPASWMPNCRGHWRLLRMDLSRACTVILGVELATHFHCSAVLVNCSTCVRASGVKL